MHPENIQKCKISNNLLVTLIKGSFIQIRMCNIQGQFKGLSKSFQGLQFYEKNWSGLYNSSSKSYCTRVLSILQNENKGGGGFSHLHLQNMGDFQIIGGEGGSLEHENAVKAHVPINPFTVMQLAR